MLYMGEMLMAEWFADETFWEEMYPRMFSEERP